MAWLAKNTAGSIFQCFHAAADIYLMLHYYFASWASCEGAKHDSRAPSSTLPTGPRRLTQEARFGTAIAARGENCPAAIAAIAGPGRAFRRESAPMPARRQPSFFIASA